MLVGNGSHRGLIHGQTGRAHPSLSGMKTVVCRLAAASLILITISAAPIEAQTRVGNVSQNVTNARPGSKPGKPTTPSATDGTQQRPPRLGQSGTSSGEVIALDGPCQPMLYGDADESGKVDIDDTLCVLNGFTGNYDDCPFEFVDIYPCPGGDGVIDGSDLDFIILAFQGFTPPECVNACRPCVNNVLPTANAGPNREAFTNEPVVFSGASSIDSDGRIVAYEWDLGGGQRVNGVTASRTYPNPGTYSVRLYVTDGCGAVSSDLVSISVTRPVCTTANAAPVSDAGLDRSGVVGERMVFNAGNSSDADGSIVNYWWSFSDGVSTGWQPAAQFDRVFTQAGQYVATLWVQDNCGASSQADTALVSVTNAVTLDPYLEGFAIGNIGTATGVGLSADGRRLFISSQEFGVVEFDTSDPRNPVFARTAHYFEPAEGVVVGNGFLVTGGPTNQAKVISMATFGTPDETRVPLGFVAHGIAVSGNMVAIAAGASGLKIVELDLTDPENIAVVSTRSLAMFARGVALSANRNFAYIGAGPQSSGGFKVVSLTGPSLSIVGSVIPTNSANPGDVVVDATGNFAYVADNGSGLTVYDVRTPSQPVRILTVGTSGPAAKIGRMGNILMVATSGGSARLHIYSLSNPASPSEIGSLAGQLIEFDARVSYLYAAMGTAGVSVIDLTDPTRPSSINVIRSSFGTRNSCASDGRVALVGGENMATAVLDVTVASAPRVVATLSSVAQDIALRGNMAYIAAGASGLRVYDFTNPGAPVLRWTVSSAGGRNLFAKGVAVSSNGAWAYLAAGSVEGVGRVVVMNIADPSRAPLVAADVPTTQGGSASDVALDSLNQYAYVADYGGGVQVFNIANPSSPVRVGAGYDTGDLATRVAVMGDLVLVATWSQQSAHMAVIDASDPANLEQMGSVPGLYSGCFDMFENYVLLPSPSLGLVVIDLANPSAPKTVFTVDTPGSVASVCRSGNMVFLGDSAAILDVANLFSD